ncbi:hypothetical protein DFS34DRAFT_135932 [Phlyctochytrium arcticum]|nr:hypothetical protein DFS34DRAFT_135932 [Phlyctochytrium arcticum]
MTFPEANGGNTGSPGIPNSQQGSSSALAARIKARKRRRTESQSNELNGGQTPQDSPRDSTYPRSNTPDRPSMPNPSTGLSLTRDQVTTILTRWGTDRSTAEAAHHFATKSLGEQLLTIFLDIQDIGRKAGHAEGSHFENWQILADLDKNIKGEVARSCKNPFKKQWYKDSEGVTDLIFEQGLGVAPKLQLISSIHQKVQTEVGYQLTQYKHKMKRVLYLQWNRGRLLERKRERERETMDRYAASQAAVSSGSVFSQRKRKSVKNKNTDARRAFIQKKKEEKDITCKGRRWLAGTPRHQDTETLGH